MTKLFMPLLLVGTLTCLAAACGESGDGGGNRDARPAEGVPDGRDPDIDTSREGLIAFAESGDYTSWFAEPEKHPSAGPHGGQVRTYFNDLAEASLRAGSDVHPRGSILVKELYGGGDDVLGYAINVKVEDGEGKDTWLFWEGYGPDYEGDYYGIANETCHGCHSAGRDYVRSPFPTE